MDNPFRHPARNDATTGATVSRRPGECRALLGTIGTPLVRLGPALYAALWLCLIQVGFASAAQPVGKIRLEGAFHPLESAATRDLGAAPGLAWESRDSATGTGGRLEIELPSLEDSLAVFVGGFPDNQSLRLSLQTPDHGHELRLGLRSVPGPAWCLFRWSLPSAWRGRPAILVAEDTSAGAWLGVGLPATSAAAHAADWSALVQSLGGVGLTLLPFFSALVLLRPLVPQDEPLLVTLALVAAGVLALAAFFGFFLSPALGVAIVAVNLLAAAVAAWKFLRQPRALARARPLLATLALAGVVISTLYLYGGAASPEAVPAGRHDLNLPSDNLIPGFFAERVYAHGPLRPFIEDWLTSDRPPLQSGFLLLSRPLLAGAAARIAAAITCQFAVYAGLWVLLAAAGVTHRAARLVLFACVTSGFFTFNALYAWPKLLPAGFLLAPAGLLYRLLRDGRRATGLEILAMGAGGALAMLGHGGSFFGLAALGAVGLIHGRWRDLRLVGGVALTAFLLYAPWLAYQHWVDPPGDRLLKYHLANHHEIDPRGALAVIVDAYHRTPAEEIAHNKWTNVCVLFGDFTNLLPNLGRSAREFLAGDWASAWWRFSNAMQAGQFFHLFQSLGFLLAGLPFLWFRRREPVTAPAGYCVAIAAASMVVWCALMFGPEGCIIHQGTYLTGATLHVAAVLGLVASGRPGLVRTVLGLHLSLWLVLWIFSPVWDPWHEVLRPSWSGFWLVVWLMALGALLWTGRQLAVGVEAPPADDSGHA